MTTRVAEVSPDSERRWFFLTVATLAQVSVAIIRLGIPALMPFIKEDFRLSRTEVGFLSSVMNGATGAAGIPCGKAVDRFGERRVIAYGCVATGLIIIGMLWAFNLTILLPILLLTGFASATSTPAGSKAVAGWFPVRERGTAMGFRQMGIPLGGAIAALTLPALALSFGWRFALAVAGLLGIVMGVVALRLYEEPSISSVSPEGGRPAGVKDLLARKDIRAVLAYVFILSGSQWSYLTYLELYLTETLRLSITLAAGLLAVGQISGAAGRVVWGLLSDRFFGGRRKSALLLVGGLAILMALWTSLFSAETPLWIVASVVAFLGLTLQGWNGLTHALAAELAGTHAAGLAAGLNITLGFLGVTVLPPIFGFIVDQTGSYPMAWIALAGTIGGGLAALHWVREKK